MPRRCQRSRRICRRRSLPRTGLRKSKSRQRTTAGPWLEARPTTRKRRSGPGPNSCPSTARICADLLVQPPRGGAGEAPFRPADAEHAAEGCLAAAAKRAEHLLELAATKVTAAALVR